MIKFDSFVCFFIWIFFSFNCSNELPFHNLFARQTVSCNLKSIENDFSNRIPIRMKFAIICSFLLLSNRYLSESATSDLSDASSEVEFIVIDANGDGKQELIHLNNYYYDVDLDLSELLRLAETNSIPISELNEAFRRRYPDYKIDIEKLNLNSSIKYHENKQEKTVLIFDYKTTYDTLKYFGNSIKKLQITNDYWYCRIDLSFVVIAKAANEYASESLTHLETAFMCAQTFEPFVNPFKNVEFFDFAYVETLHNDKTFDQLFPKLKRLNVIFVNDAYYNYINCKMPQLIDLKFFIDSMVDFPSGKADIEGFLSKNPQIRSVESNQVRMINKFLPNIENLTLYEFELRNDETLCFENVKILIMPNRMPLSQLKQISFPQLESLTMKFNLLDSATSEYLFGQHRNLKKLDFEVRIIETNDEAEVNRLTAILTELIEIKLSIHANIKVPYVGTLIANHAHMTKLGLIAQDVDVDGIGKQFGDQWDIQEFIPSDNHYGKGIMMKKTK